MSVNDPISDMICRINNAQKAGLKEVVVIFSNSNLAILSVLKEDGYILELKKEEIRKGVHIIKVSLSYTDTSPTIKYFSRISKPGCRVYSPNKKARKFKNGLGTGILSTSKGIMSDHQASLLNVGGELICSVF